MASSTVTTVTTVTAINILSERGASDYIGEPVTQIQHSLQTAYFGFNYILNVSEKSRDYDRRYFVIACLFHDIGHLLKKSDFPTDLNIREMLDPETSLSLGIQSHEHLGAAYLRLLKFPEEIPALVESHVDAKRYRVARDAAYAAKLSEASRRTLLLQGGPMTEEESIRFENHKLCTDRLLLRSCDEAAKETQIKYADLDLAEYWNQRKPLDAVPTINSFAEWISTFILGNIL